MYNGGGADAQGTTQERADRCSVACKNKKTALSEGPWSSRGDAVGFGVYEGNGRCYCQHEERATCTTAYESYYTAYEYDLPAAVTKAPSSHDYSAVTRTVPPEPVSECWSTGDPHFKPFSGSQFDFQQPGEYQLIGSAADQMVTDWPSELLLVATVHSKLSHWPI